MLDELEVPACSRLEEEEEEDGPATSVISGEGSVLMGSVSLGSLGNTGKTSKGIPSLLTFILIS